LICDDTGKRDVGACYDGEGGSGVADGKIGSSRGADGGDGNGCVVGEIGVVGARSDAGDIHDLRAAHGAGRNCDDDGEGDACGVDGENARGGVAGDGAGSANGGSGARPTCGNGDGVESGVGRSGLGEDGIDGVHGAVIGDDLRVSDRATG